MGGKKSESESKTRAFDPTALTGLISELGQFGRQLSGAQDNAPQLQGLGQAPKLGLGAGGLTSGEQSSFDNQLAAIEAGGVGGQQAIQQSVRERATATGFGGSSSSRGAIAQEASQLGQFEQFQASQRANVFGQQGQLQRQGLLAGAQIDLQGRGQDLQARGQGLQAQQFGQQNRLQELQLALQALQSGGQLAGIGQTKSRSSAVGFGA